MTELEAIKKIGQSIRLTRYIHLKELNITNYVWNIL